MSTSDKKIPSTLPEEDMSIPPLPMSIAALGQLGLSSLDDQTADALIATIRRLSELDEREPDLGIREQVQAALQLSEPVVVIGKVLNQYRDRLS